MSNQYEKTEFSQISENNYRYRSSLDDQLTSDCSLHGTRDNKNEFSKTDIESYYGRSSLDYELKSGSFPHGDEDENAYHQKEPGQTPEAPTKRGNKGRMSISPLLWATSYHDEKSSINSPDRIRQDPYPPNCEEQKQDEYLFPERNVLLNCLGRYFITLILCISYIVVTLMWLDKSGTSNLGKRIFSSIITGISIGLGLNISGSFREIALTMRWSVLALGKQNLQEMDLLLQSQNLFTFFRLAFDSRRPAIQMGCLTWISANIFTQVGLALLSLTYGFDDDSEKVHLEPGRAAIPRMNHFYARNNHVASTYSLQDEQYTAHVYGQFALSFGIGLISSQPDLGERYLTTIPLIWLDKNNSLVEFVFLDSPQGSRAVDSFSAFTDRKISLNYTCQSFDVLVGGDGTNTEITVNGVGKILLSEAVPNSTTYLTRPDHSCQGNNRCSIVEAFEASYTDPWYHVCEISLSETQNDPRGLSTISDDIAQIATASIAQVGFTDSRGYASETYPRESLWGQRSRGDSQGIGMMMGIYAIASIAGAAQFNPFTSYATQKSPAPGFRLRLKHPTSFSLILSLINITQLTFVITTIVLSKKGKAIAFGFIDILLLLKPISDRLPKFCLNEDAKDSMELKLNLYTRYEKETDSKTGWTFKLYQK